MQGNRSWKIKATTSYMSTIRGSTVLTQQKSVGNQRTSQEFEHRANRGQRLIIVHAGSRTGFINGAKLIYKSSSSTGDYHREMNSNNFTKWLKEMLIPNLPPHSAVVMDNASYHTTQAQKCPTSSSRKDQIKVIILYNTLQCLNIMNICFQIKVYLVTLYYHIVI